MKTKLLFIFFATILATKAFSQATIGGPSIVCGGSTVGFSVGLPVGAKDATVSGPVAGGGNAGTGIGLNFPVQWLNYSCDETGYVSATVMYTDANNEQHLEYPRMNVTVRRIGGMSAISGNASPYICSTDILTYSIPPVCKATNYSWTLPSGWQADPSTPITGSDATTIRVIPTATTGGVLRVVATYSPNNCNLSVSSSLSITRPAQIPVFTTTTTKYCLLNTSSAQFCIASIPNATNYSWSYPSGWSGPGVTTTPCIAFNFNGVAQTANICCTANLSCGAQASSCLSVTTDSSIPTDAGVYWSPPTVASTPTPAKKNVTFSLGSYYWSASKSSMGSNGQYTTVWTQSNSSQASPSGGTYTVLMISGDILSISGWNKNSCGTSNGIGRGYKLVNGVLQPYELQALPTLVDEEQKNNFSVYPNPANSLITIITQENTAGPCNLFMFDVLGKKVKEMVAMNNKTVQLNVSDLENGIYFLQIENEYGIIRKEKIMIAH